MRAIFILTGIYFCSDQQFAFFKSESMYKWMVLHFYDRETASKPLCFLHWLHLFSCTIDWLRWLLVIWLKLFCPPSLLNSAFRARARNSMLKERLQWNKCLKCLKLVVNEQGYSLNDFSVRNWDKKLTVEQISLKIFREPV